jgi:hypothetical protein
MNLKIHFHSLYIASSVYLFITLYILSIHTRLTNLLDFERVNIHSKLKKMIKKANGCKLISDHIEFNSINITVMLIIPGM